MEYSISMKTLRKYATDNGVGYRAAWNRFNAGKIPGAFQDSFGKILVPEDAASKPLRVVVYCRVSSSENKCNLDGQAERLVRFANLNGLPVSQIVKECGSGLNDNRKKLRGVLNDTTMTHLVVEHKDRLTRFGYAYLETLAEARGFKIVVVNQATTDRDDLMQDFVSLVTSFCARLYGQRRSRRNTEKILEGLQK